MGGYCSHAYCQIFRYSTVQESEINYDYSIIEFWATENIFNKLMTTQQDRLVLLLEKSQYAVGRIKYFIKIVEAVVQYLNIVAAA